MTYVLEHALLNLGKHKGRNILLGVILVAVITALFVALSIFNTTGVIINDTRGALQSAVRVGPQTQRVVGSQGQGVEPRVTMEQYEAWGDSAYVDGFDVSEGNGPDGVEAVYYLSDPGLLGAFEAELRSEGLPDDYVVRTDSALFDATAGSVQSLQDIALTFLIIVVVLGAAIMVLASIISIRERKYEIGVLRSMGMKRHLVGLGLITEIVAITCVGFGLALGAGTLLAQPVSDALLAGQSETAASGSGSSLADRLGTEDDTAQAIDEVTVAATAGTTLEVFGIAIGLAGVGGLVSVSRITRYEPIKILMERN
jgi:putative ABC transport system permease protein